MNVNDGRVHTLRAMLMLINWVHVNQDEHWVHVNQDEAEGEILIIPQHTVGQAHQTSRNLHQSHTFRDSS